MDEQAVNLMHDMLNYDALNDVDEDMLEYSMNLIHNSSVADCEKIKHLLLNIHKFILEQFIILLLCLDEDKWKYCDIDNLYNNHMRSTDMLYKTFLSKELSQLLNILKEISPKNFRMPKCENKIDKANTLGYILGHYNRVNMKRKKLKAMKTLCELCWDEIHINVPVNVLHIAGDEWLFNLCLPKWLHRSPVPVRYSKR